MMEPDTRLLQFCFTLVHLAAQMHIPAIGQCLYGDRLAVRAEIPVFGYDEQKFHTRKLMRERVMPPMISMCMVLFSV